MIVHASSHLPLTRSYRLSKLELLDEVEELDLVLAHYAVITGSKTVGGDILGRLWTRAEGPNQGLCS